MLGGLFAFLFGVAGMGTQENICFSDTAANTKLPEIC